MILLKVKKVDRPRDLTVTVVILRDKGLKNVSGSPELCSSFSVALQTFLTATIVFPYGLRKQGILMTQENGYTPWLV